MYDHNSLPPPPHLKRETDRFYNINNIRDEGGGGDKLDTSIYPVLACTLESEVEVVVYFFF